MESKKRTKKKKTPPTLFSDPLGELPLVHRTVCREVFFQRKTKGRIILLVSLRVTSLPAATGVVLLFLSLCFPCRVDSNQTKNRCRVRENPTPCE